jgi:hypothetical protein
MKLTFSSSYGSWSELCEHDEQVPAKKSESSTEIWVEEDDHLLVFVVILVLICKDLFWWVYKQSSIGFHRLLVEIRDGQSRELAGRMGASY